MRLTTPRRLVALVGLLATTACTQMPQTEDTPGIAPQRLSFAMEEVDALKSRGARVWCVPFARNLSGVEIRGNARTWWGQAQDSYPVSQAPEIGAVMVFRATPSMPLGHVAVVSGREGERRLLIDHANWHRNEVSLGMAVIDVSEANDWSRVRVETVPGAFGSVYPVEGFILPDA